MAMHEDERVNELYKFVPFLSAAWMIEALTNIDYADIMTRKEVSITTVQQRVVWVLQRTPCHYQSLLSLPFVN